MFNYQQVKHTTSGDILGQTLTFNTNDEWELEYHQQMKNAINNADVLGMSILVTDGQLQTVFYKNWVREIEAPEPTEEQTEEQTEK